MTKDKINNDSVEVLMLIGPQCVHCGPIMQILTELMKTGDIAQLKFINIEKNVDVASRYAVRSVPWLLIGDFELSGVRTKQEIQLWLNRAGSDDGLSEYIEEMLLEGNIASVNRLIERNTRVLQSVIQLMKDAEAKINVRLGISVIIEDHAESPDFKRLTPILLDFLSDEDKRIRGDACHYLSLTKDISYIPFIEKLLTDSSAEVREIAEDSLQDLRQL